MSKNIKEQNWGDMKKIIEGKLDQIKRQIDDYHEVKDWYWQME